MMEDTTAEGARSKPGKLNAAEGGENLCHGSILFKRFVKRSDARTYSGGGGPSNERQTSPRDDRALNSSL